MRTSPIGTHATPTLSCWWLQGFKSRVKDKSCTGFAAVPEPPFLDSNGVSVSAGWLGLALRPIEGVTLP